MPSNTTKEMKLTLKVWRQKGPEQPGAFVTYEMNKANADMSFLEMMDVLNEDLVRKSEEPVAFDHDCREGICGSCSMVINGNPHGPELGTATCQLHLRKFADGATIWIEPFRATAFPIRKDLSTDRSALDRIIKAGGFVSVNTGNAVDANAVPIAKPIADMAFAASACIGCGACVASCKNASAALFTAAKITHLSLLPQGAPERLRRVRAMVAQMDAEGFGACSNTGACSAACPKEISLETIARMNREYARANLLARDEKAAGGHG